MDTWPAARFAMMPGMEYGLTLVGPLAIKVSLVFSSVNRPPSPTPTKHPARSRSWSVISSLASLTAMEAAPSASSVKRSISLSFFRSMKRVGSQPLTSPAMRTRKAEQSNSEMGPMPLCPASSALQDSAVPMPTGVTRPMPVMTTRSIGDALLLSVLLDVVDGVLDGADLLRVFVRDVDLESLFERQHELHQAERVGTQVVDEARLGLDVLLVDVELLLDDALDLGGDVGSHSLLALVSEKRPGVERQRRVACFAASRRAAAAPGLSDGAPAPSESLTCACRR